MERAPDGRQSISVSRIFPNSPQEVFDAWTTPEKMKGWWKFGDDWTTDEASVDLRKGGEFRIGATHQKTGEVLSVRGVYYEVVPSRKLTFSFIIEGQIATADEELVTVEFHDFHGDTRMDLTHTRIKKDGSALLRKRGWESMLANLSVLLAGSRPSADI